MSELIDPLDVSSRTESDWRDDAIAARRRAAALEGKTADDSAETCRVCTEPLSAKRRAAYPGTQTCVPCQTDLELALSQRRR